MINLPKTGSTFAEKAIVQLYKPYFQRRYPQYWLPGKKAFKLLFPHIGFSRDKILQGKASIGKHGVYSQIPEKHKSKRILSIIRNPFDRLLSLYHFKEWRYHLPEAQILQQYSSFPNLSFEEYVDYHYRFGTKDLTLGLNTEFKYGPQTAMFIHFFAKDPVKTFESIRGDFSIKNNPDLFGEVDFLHTENLNQELFDYLQSLGYEEKKIAFIKEMGKRNVSEKKEKIVLSDVTRQSIYENEKPLFELFPEYLSKE